MFRFIAMLALSVGFVSTFTPSFASDYYKSDLGTPVMGTWKMARNDGTMLKFTFGPNGEFFEQDISGNYIVGERKGKYSYANGTITVRYTTDRSKEVFSVKFKNNSMHMISDAGYEQTVTRSR